VLNNINQPNQSNSIASLSFSAAVCSIATYMYMRSHFLLFE
jgi:hypothetical protein